MANNGQNRSVVISKGWDPMNRGISNGAVIFTAKGSTGCTSGVLATYKSGSKNGELSLVPVSAYTPGTSNKTAFLITNGVELPGNSHVRSMNGEAPVDAAKFTTIGEVQVLSLYVAPVLGSTPGLCVITTEGTAAPTAKQGMLAWGTPGQGTFAVSAGVNPVAVALGSDVHVLDNGTANAYPYISFIIN